MGVSFRVISVPESLFTDDIQIYQNKVKHQSFLLMQLIYNDPVPKKATAY